MGAPRVLAAALLVTMVACGRSALHKGRADRPADATDSGAANGGALGGGGSPIAHSEGGVRGFGGTPANGGTLAGMGGGGGLKATSRGGAPGNGGTPAAGGARPTGGNSANGGSSIVGPPRGGAISGGRAGRDASVGGSLGRDGGLPDLPVTVDLPIMSLATGGRVGIDGPVATGGISRTDGPMANGGATPSGGIAAGGATGFGGLATGGAAATGGAGGNPNTCGDGKIDPGEQCDLGPDNAASAAFLVTQGGTSFAAVPFTRTGTSTEFYAYSSLSAHTGYEALGMSRILLYLDKSTRGLSLIVFHGVDQDSSRLEQPSSTIQFLFSGLPDSTAIDISDDPRELIMTSPTTATGLWNFTNNSDGGVFHGIPLPGDWTIIVEPYFIKGDWTWTWLTPDGSELHLDASQPVSIEARSTHGECRADCTVPRCGDGILDAGEVCDDGQPSILGCSLDCMSFD